MQTKRKIYRIELNEIDSIFTDCVLLAAMSNGGDYTPLDKIADVADYLCKKYPTTGENHSVNRIGNNSLTIDKGTKNIVHITEIDVLDWKDESPTISRYDAQTIIQEIEQNNDNQN